MVDGRGAARAEANREAREWPATRAACAHKRQRATPHPPVSVLCSAHARPHSQQKWWPQPQRMWLQPPCFCIGGQGRANGEAQCHGRPARLCPAFRRLYCRHASALPSGACTACTALRDPRTPLNTPPVCPRPAPTQPPTHLYVRLAARAALGVALQPHAIFVRRHLTQLSQLILPLVHLQGAGKQGRRRVCGSGDSCWWAGQSTNEGGEEADRRRCCHCDSCDKAVRQLPAGAACPLAPTATPPTYAPLDLDHLAAGRRLMRLLAAPPAEAVAAGPAHGIQAGSLCCRRCCKTRSFFREQQHGAAAGAGAAAQDGWVVGCVLLSEQQLEALQAAGPQQARRRRHGQRRSAAGLRAGAAPRVAWMAGRGHWDAAGGKESVQSNEQRSACCLCARDYTVPPLPR